MNRHVTLNHARFLRDPRSPRTDACATGVVVAAAVAGAVVIPMAQIVETGPAVAAAATEPCAGIQ